MNIRKMSAFGFVGALTFSSLVLAQNELSFREQLVVDVVTRSDNDHIVEDPIFSDNWELIDAYYTSHPRVNYPDQKYFDRDLDRKAFQSIEYIQRIHDLPYYKWVISNNWSNPKKYGTYEATFADTIYYFESETYELEIERRTFDGADSDRISNGLNKPYDYLADKVGFSFGGGYRDLGCDVAKKDGETLMVCSAQNQIFEKNNGLHLKDITILLTPRRSL